MDLTVLLPEPVGPITLEDGEGSLALIEAIETATYMTNLSC
jgi:hypothetical protein